MKQSLKDLNQTIMTKPILATAVFALLLVFIVSLFVFFSNEKSKLIKETYIELETINNYKLNLVNFWLKEREGDAEFISNIHLMHKEFLKLSNDPNNNKIKSEIKNHYSLLKDAYMYDNIIICDRNGKNILAVDENNNEISKETFTAIRNTLKSRHITSTYLSKDSNCYFDIVFPLYYTENEVNINDVVYVVLKLNPTKHLARIINSWPVQNETAESILYEKNADNVYNIVELKMPNAKPRQIELTMTDTNVLIIKSIANKMGYVEGNDYKKKDVYGVSAKMNKLNWYLITKIEKNEVFKEFNYIMYVTITVITILFILSVIILLYIRRDEKNSLYEDLYKNELILRLKNEIFKTTLYSIGDGVITTDDKGIITQMNPVAEELTGWKEIEAIGQRLENVYTIYNEITGDELVSPVTKVLHTGEIFLLSNSTIVLSKNAKKTPIANSAAPIRDESGKLIGVVLVIRDHTEEKLARKKIIDKEQFAIEIFQKLNEAQKLARIGSWEIDLITNETWWSDEVYSIFEENRETFKPHSNSNDKYVAVEKLAEKRELVHQAIAEHKEFEFEEEIRTANGNFKFCRIIGKAIYNNNGEAIKLVASVMDITQLHNANKALMDNISNYKNLVEMSQEAILVHRNNKIIYANESCLQLLNAKHNELLGKEISQIIHPESLEIVEARLKSLEQGGKPGIYRVNLVKLDGTILTAETSSSRYIDSEGVAYQVMIRDVTERIEYEKQLRKLSRAIEQNPASILITDLLGRIEYVNPKFEEVTGYKFEDVKGENPRFLKSGHTTKEEYIELWETITDGKIWNGEFLNVKKNKELHWESTTIAPIYNENGIITNFVGIKLDITDKKIAGQLLAENEYKFRSYIEKAPIGIFITDVKGIITDINQTCASFSGLDASYVIGKSFDQFLVEDYQNEVLDKYTKLQVGDSYSIELEVYNKDMNKIWLVIHTTHLSDNVYLSYALDINDIKKYQEELITSKEKAEEMSKLKSSFLANMSHELRTPMIGILGFTQLIEHEDDLNEIREMSHLVYESGRRLMDTLNSILNLSKIESGSVKIQEDTFDLIPFLFEVTQIYQSLTKQNNLDFKIINKDSELKLVTDKKMLTDIINNLINNAIKFTEVGSITLTEDVIEIDNKPFVKIDVIDTGIGISEENVGFIFEEFRQGSEGIARKYEGSGLGLTVSRKYALLLDGDLSVVSEKGKGSTFTLIFPLKRNELKNSAESNQKELNPITNSSSSGLKKLLYVEDDDISIQYLKRICPKHFEVFSTRNKADALNILKSNKIDMILMDINLGDDENGIDITQTIKNISDFKDIPIAACTAYAMHGDRESFIQKGCDDYISKPFEKSALIKLLDKWTN